MPDKKKTVTKKPKVEKKPVVEEKPVTEEKPVEVPVVEEPSVSPAVPADDTAAPAGTDQLGRQLYDVKCSKCGKQTQVPFKPSGDRPVYCRDCYMEQRKGGMG